MRLILVAALSMLALSSQAEPACDFQEDMCLAQEAFEAVDAQMEQTLAAIETKIESNGFEDYMVEPDDIRDSLELGQTSWSSYRDAHCAAVFRLMSGGTTRHEDELVCLAELTAARTTQLQSLYEVTTDTITDDDLSWLNGVWFESCGAKQASFRFYVDSDGVYAEVAPDADMPFDEDQLTKADILLARNGFIEVTPYGWDNLFLRVKSAGEDHIIGDLVEIFPNSVAPIEAIDLVRCWAAPDSDE
ncbi:lysozyme inhibitor LprI family protein [Henriciella litoralis]|uniref:lysozyme inhibitor LprI family protein n=1 Tax=Henriciella litoralis TaxID=568102 RepID=UPI000A034F8C|nr:lysozyme inhibitor LprI family protein [Henriciella litoralis]